MLPVWIPQICVPLYWQVGQLHQDKYPGALSRIPLLSLLVTACIYVYCSDSGGLLCYEEGSSARGLFQVGHPGPSRIPAYLTYYRRWQSWSTVLGDTESTTFPEVGITVCLPKAYKTLYFYRCYIRGSHLQWSGQSAPPAEVSRRLSTDDQFIDPTQCGQARIGTADPRIASQEQWKNLP